MRLQRGDGVVEVTARVEAVGTVSWFTAGDLIVFPFRQRDAPVAVGTAGFAIHDRELDWGTRPVSRGLSQ